MLRILLGTAISALALVGCQQTPSMDDAEPMADVSRTFDIEYVAQVKDLPTDRPFRLWIPIPSDDPHQSIGKVSVESPFPYRVTAEPVHGNRMIYLEGTSPTPELAVTVRYRVDRRPYQVDLSKASSVKKSEPVPVVYTQPSKLCIVNDRVRGIARKASTGSDTTVEKAHSFYEHVFDEMSYGKPSDRAWGRGDTIYACDEKVGNCTDFHSYFISLCLAEGIPARFQIGLYGKYEEMPGDSYETGGYHCWAEFHDDELGWVPVDISEADKDPSRFEQFFGGHTDNRVTLSTGRDLRLSPAQSADSLNYFVNPYVEVDGKPHGGVGKVVTWTDR